MVSGITDYGKTIKLRLLEQEKTQEWLISEVSKKAGRYFDSSYLHKVMVGKIKNKVIIDAINEVLGN